MPEIKIDIGVWCSCGKYSNNCDLVESGKGYYFISVEPCEKCLKDAEERGYKNGYDSGHEDGYEKGKGEDK